MINFQQYLPKRPISALLRKARCVPDTAKIQHVFQSLGYAKSITRISIKPDRVVVRTKISTLGVLDVATFAEHLRAKDVDMSCGRSGLVMLFKYD